MARLFEESFKIMAVELSCLKGSVSAATIVLGIDPDRVTNWRMDARFNGGNLLPKNDKLSPEEQELRELKKRLKEAELENEILKKAVAIFQGRLKVYWFIKENMNQYAADKMRSVLKVSSSGFYKWMKKK